MALSDELCGVLKLGADKERAARDFYLQAAGRCANALGKQMLRRLADEETKHQQLLESWANQGLCPAGGGKPALDADFVKKGRQKVAEAVKPATTDLDAIQFGQEMERQAIQFYQDAADTTDDRNSKDLLLRLRAEEDRHLALLTDLYEYMKDPGIWSVREGGAHFDS